MAGWHFVEGLRTLDSNYTIEGGGLITRKMIDTERSVAAPAIAISPLLWKPLSQAESESELEPDSGPATEPARGEA